MYMKVEIKFINAVYAIFKGFKLALVLEPGTLAILTATGGGS